MDIKNSLKDKVAIITGASEGIGRALAKTCATAGAVVIASARNFERLESLKSEIPELSHNIIPIKTDVGNIKDCETLVNETIKLCGKIDILVNNAGRTMWCRFDEITNIGIIDEIMKPNLYGAIYCTYFALPHIYKTKGQIVAISSVAGLTGVPCRTIYSASKHAMIGFFESLRLEVEPKGVSVTIVAPDFVKSEIHKRALKEDGSSLGSTPMIESKIMTAEECASLILKAMLKRKRLLITSTRGKIGMWLKLIWPSFVDKLAIKAIERKY